MNPEQMIADLESKAQQLQQRSHQMQEQIQHAGSTITSPNEAVTVKIAPNGALQHIEFSPVAMRLTHVQLSQLVMQTVQKAQIQAAEQVASIVEPEFGGTEAMDFLRSFIPQPEEEEPPPPPEEGQVMREVSWNDPAQKPAPRPRPQRPADDDEDGFGSVLR
ncbi:Conserved DNA-binding protein YbaB [Lentzea albidocapillata subsp. violacea]|uniref:Conserved DNA-binding protein YbaB n=1 Tax=Lentzea albidocapillata subsp. violacea TaxID=128104 RepID=A0A1G9KW02_9PSEU|nr:YbaB/EbfC family nucleoid-associated protein [Lentzea albidocapillata]SDL53766.1 Conserved DNA-binding protein YbaB [Lentzea albidocapillata subsp. violacea]